MNISLPDELKAFVDQHVSTGGYGTDSEFIRELIRRERDRQQLRRLVLDGIESGPGQIADRAFFEELRAVANDQRPA